MLFAAWNWRERENHERGGKLAELLYKLDGFIFKLVLERVQPEHWLQYCQGGTDGGWTATQYSCGGTCCGGVWKSCVTDLAITIVFPVLILILKKRKMCYMELYFHFVYLIGGVWECHRSWVAKKVPQE
ncbi:hypothetical protein Y1Q_0008224 [Alligator mississippiensis]|uniref:Uncharacterized protein n=1 Tax=Alligator mississippiensis TaxID=8496 RepID=A0A151N1Q0_ALLMI|nr:hypothetical protein Y1Q_0008224 [Alligator mississippiensis]